ncbi:MAG: DUF4258 domain-containing protein [Bacteroidia bacterium]|nr:DUF4258 domain-containing protein [Bacteroidia bacterium]
MLIEFSQHSLLKIEILQEHGIKLSKETVEEIINSPDKIVNGDKGRLIAQKGFDLTHVIRVVYEVHQDSIKIITIYPGRRSRYEKD